MPIRSITYESKSDKISYKAAAEEPGPTCVKLLSTLKGIQQGKVDDQFGWLLNVGQPAQWGVVNGEEAQKDTVDGLP